MALDPTQTLAGIIAGALVVGLVAFLILYVYTALVLQSIAKKTKTEPSWLAWIPIANLFLMILIIDKPLWWVLGFLLSIVPFIGPLLAIAFAVYVWWLIAEKRGKPGWWGLLMLIPIVNLIMMGVIAWSD